MPINPLQHRVLVVDQNVHAAETLGCWLEMASHRVLTAYDGFAAVAQARTFCPDAVILDIALPGLDGFEVASALRALPESHRIVIVAHTSYRDGDYQKRAADAGIDHYVLKPAQPYELRKLLGNRNRAPVASVHPSEVDLQRRAAWT